MRLPESPHQPHRARNNNDIPPLFYMVTARVSDFIKEKAKAALFGETKKAKTHEITDGEIETMKEVLEISYKETVSMLQETGICDIENDSISGVPLPTFEQAFATFTREQLAIAKTFKQPDFQLEPLTAFQNILDALNRNLLQQQCETYIHPKYAKKWQKQDESQFYQDHIYGWKTAITESEPDMEQDLEMEGIVLKKLLYWYQKWGEKGLRLPNKIRYALLQLKAMRKGELLDIETATVLHTEDPFPAAGILVGSYDDNEIAYTEESHISKSDFFRFRKSIVNSVPNDRSNL